MSLLSHSPSLRRRTAAAGNSTVPIGDNNQTLPTPAMRIMQALAAVSLRGYDLGSLQQTLEVISRSSDSRPLSLFGLFEFRHLLTSWRLDGRQHDVAEFPGHLQQNPVGSAQPSPWQGRSDGVVQDSDVGLSALMLPLSQDPLSVSSCLSLWQSQEFPRALCCAPELLAVVTCRWQDGTKRVAGGSSGACLDFR